MKINVLFLSAVGMLIAHLLIGSPPIDEHILTIPATEIFKIKPVMTIVGGKIVYKAK